MLRFEKLAGNARRFKMLMGMSLQEFNLLYAEVEKIYLEEERESLSKRPRMRAIGAGRRFALSPRDRVLLPVLPQDVRHPGRGGRGFRCRPGHRLALHGPDGANLGKAPSHAGKALRGG